MELVTNHPGVFGDLLLQLPFGPPRISKEKLNFIRPDRAAVYQYFQNLEVATPIHAITQANTAIEPIIALMYELNGILSNGSANEKPEISFRDIGHYVT